ncbi:MAG: hypothetical protein A2836_01300 [Candidatus Taylorbacteria bacterium RIFCSPHIGHO2_01_FULL_45_63]|uniref:ComEC/Rec2-related protein domain-containing protein n=1 Tax=Candidatus Taylorbacteria bacterium RIFCSPHIGHO2_02_FULL_45_35 TaxID=1802311 RepID=A0A1G2MPH2_9BACT|nr:MAG: hypothetical protein A2836_01300 [Candidatus Taylorbacteria bacterium RIFCSPHIGHO2_01_FULL_45_63]OHA25785.1 MAG: hypothetical protein A3D56_01630 [Candidatus Taylorbacteria bacterium RIFCSPHIGHO2_02_FULL_45_35]OHA32302.1 MAG: hypothetical protein A3A22_01845 [Candidatus Taylorbacteria bacterium RIFCSPLOWO2_01_FULL_45_34b]
MAERIFYIVIGSFVLGVTTGSFVLVPESAFLFFILLGFVIFLYFLFLLRHGGEWRIVLCISLLFFSFGAGLWRISFFHEASKNESVAKLFNRSVAIEGVVSGEPDRRETSLRFVVRTDFRMEGQEEVPFKATILVVTDPYQIISYGDLVRVSGLFQKPTNFDTENGRQFDYVSYLAKDGICCQFFRPEISVVASGKGNVVLSFLYDIKNMFVGSISRILSEPEGSLLSGIILGAKHGLPQTLLDAFKTAGVIHIVVLSGYNITLVAAGFSKLFSFLSRRFRFIVPLLAILGFTLMTGASATAVRASLMAALVIFAKTIGRNYDMSRALLVAGTLMILHNPAILVFDPSFQLSVLATLALIYLSPVISQKLLFIPERFGFREIVSSTVSTQIFVLPFLMWMTGQVSLIALPVNFLILVIIPMTMFFGFAAGFLGIISHTLALPVAFVSYLFLHYIVKVVEIASKIPFASVHFISPHFYAVIIAYVILVFLIWRINRSLA